MRKLLASILILVTQCAFSQGLDSPPGHTKGERKADFITQIDINQVTKDGIYLNGYVVNIPHAKLTELNGKTVRIRGKVKVVEGVGDFHGGEASQGRQSETKYIPRPRIRIVKR
jgi:hypothetical protein